MVVSEKKGKEKNARRSKVDIVNNEILPPHTQITYIPCHVKIIIHTLMTMSHFVESPHSFIHSFCFVSFESKSYDKIYI